MFVDCRVRREGAGRVALVGVHHPGEACALIGGGSGRVWPSSSRRCKLVDCRVLRHVGSGPGPHWLVFTFQLLHARRSHIATGENGIGFGVDGLHLPGDECSLIATCNGKLPLLIASLTERTATWNRRIEFFPLCCKPLK